jgi:hypothetical protein
VNELIIVFHHHHRPLFKMTVLLSSPPRYQHQPQQPEQSPRQGQRHHHHHHHHHQQPPQQHQHAQNNNSNSNNSNKKLPPEALMKTVGIFGTSYSLVLRVLESDPTQARYVSRDDCSVLHMLCRYPDVPDQVVQALIDAYPEALVLRGGLFQSTPLAVVCEQRGVVDDKNMMSVIARLVQANPETLHMTDGRGLLPVQIAEQHGHARIVQLLQQLQQQQQQQLSSSHGRRR